VDQGHQKGKRGSQNRAEKLAGGTIEVVSIPAMAASTVRQKSSAVLVGGISGTGETGGGNSVVGLAVVASVTGTVVAVGNGGTGAGGVGRSTTLTLLAKSAVGGSSGGGGLVNTWELAIGDGDGTGWEGGSASTGVVSGDTTGLVDNEVLVGLAQSGRPVPGGGGGVGTRVHLGVSGELSEGGGACVGGQRSGANGTGSPVEARRADVSGRAAHAVLGSSARGSVAVGNQANESKESNELHE